MDMEYLKDEIAKVIMPSEGVKGESLCCIINEKASADEPNPPQEMEVRIATYPFVDDDDDDVVDDQYRYCDEPSDLFRMCDPNAEEFDFYIVAFHGQNAHWDREHEPLDGEGTAYLDYRGEKARLTIRDRYSRVLFEHEYNADECRDLWCEFDFDGTHYKVNVFDQPDDYGVGCWLYPNGDVSEQDIPLELRVYENEALVRSIND